MSKLERLKKFWKPLLVTWLTINTVGIVLLAVAITTSEDAIGGLQFDTAVAVGRLDTHDERLFDLEAASSEFAATQEDNAAEEEQSKLDIVLLQYKADASANDMYFDWSLNGAEQNAHTFCPSAIANQTTRGHSYYGMLDEISDLEEQYGEYRYSIPYIGTNLNALNGIAQVVRDRCSAAGYELPKS